MWELFSDGDIPYCQHQNQVVAEQILAGTRLSKPDGCPEDVYKIMQQCWQDDPAARPSFQVGFLALHTLTSYAKELSQQFEKLKKDYGSNTELEAKEVKQYPEFYANIPQ